MVKLGRLAIRRHRAGVADAVFGGIASDARDLLSFAPINFALPSGAAAVCTTNWQTCPAGAAHRNTGACCAFAAGANRAGSAKPSAANMSVVLMM
jgi:hypothetical protein